MGGMTHADTDLATRLGEIAEYEHTVHSTLMTRIFRRLGPTKVFIALYRRFGPKVDPWVMRSRGGRTMTRLYGLPGLLLDTTGVKTGLVRTSPLLYVRDGDDFVVIGTNFGQLAPRRGRRTCSPIPRPPSKSPKSGSPSRRNSSTRPAGTGTGSVSARSMRATPGTWRPVGTACRGCSCCIPRPESSTTNAPAAGWHSVLMRSGTLGFRPLILSASGSPRPHRLNRRAT